MIHRTREGCYLRLGFNWDLRLHDENNLYSTYQSYLYLALLIPFWVSKRKWRSYIYDIYVYGWVLKVASFKFKIYFNTCDRGVGKQVCWNNTSLAGKDYRE
jgi:hypothetical protein